MELKNRLEFVTLINERGYKKGIEIGVRLGYFSQYLLAKSNLELLISLDPWTPNAELSASCFDCDNVYKEAFDRLRPFGERSQIIRGSSPEEADCFDDDLFDFIYIDALHDYHSVAADLAAWWPKLKSGGMFAGHDMDEKEWPGVWRAVTEFTQQWGLIYNLTGLGDNHGETDGNRQSWWLTKP